MPKISKIEIQKNRPDRYSVYIDGKYRYSVSGNDLISSKIFVGQEVSENQLENLLRVAGLSKIIDKVYNYLSYRVRTEAEVRSYLKRHNCESELADDVLERLKQQNLLNDGEFAEAWIGTRKSVRPRSRRRLEQELRQKGIDQALVAETLAEVTDDDEIEAIKTIAKKKLLLKRHQDQQKLIRYLIGQGFDYGLIKRALGDLGATGSE